MRLVLVLGLVSTACALAVGAPTQAGTGSPPYLGDVAPVWSPRGDWIAYTDGLAGTSLVRSDGSERFSLPHSASWSPDGRLIASWNQLTLYDVDRRTSTPLRRYQAGHPTWSPDGTRIAFSAGSYSDQDIRVIGADGVGETSLTNTRGVVESNPSWSPRGDLIAFSTEGRIEVIHPDGSGRRVVWRGNLQAHLSWSPDGTRIAFVRWVATAARELLVVDVATGVLTSIERGNIVPATPSWSPDAARLAYGVGGYPYGPTTIHTARADGSMVSELREGAFPAWSPDGTRLAFVSAEGCRPIRWGVFVGRLDGSDARRITNECWIFGSPVPDRLVGTRVYDFIDAGDGDDRVEAGLGADLVSGGAGNDVVLGEEGWDSLAGGPGDDVLDGGTGRDNLVGGPGRDNLLGGIGRDHVSAADGEVEVIRCGLNKPDVVVADRIDVVARDCESVTRA